MLERIVERSALGGGGGDISDLLFDHLAVEAALASVAEGDNTIDHREESVVTPHAHAVASFDLGAALAHNDVARADSLSSTALDAEKFRL